MAGHVHELHVVTFGVFLARISAAVGKFLGVTLRGLDMVGGHLHEVRLRRAVHAPLQKTLPPHLALKLNA